MKKSSPILDVIVLILLAGSLLAGLLFVNDIAVCGKGLMVLLFMVSAYILPLYAIIRFLLNPKKYDRFADIREEGYSSTNVSLGIVGITFLIITKEMDIFVIAIFISVLVMIIFDLLTKAYLMDKIPESHRQNFQLIAGLYVGFFIYPILFAYKILL